jgi:SAM-dependent methyltransferase
MPEDSKTLEWMRSDWNRRAREDAYYYVAFAHPHQSTEDFQSTAAAALPMLEAELVRLPTADPRSRRALEVGCGPGRLMLPMSRHFAEIHGVDVSDEMIGIARELLRGVPGTRVHVNDGTGLAMFQDSYFDFTYSYAVFQHIPSKEVVLNYLREIGRVLRRGGIFRGHFCGLPQGEHPDTWGGCSFTGDEIARFASSHGFQLLAISGEGTQYMLVTLRKADRFANADVSGTRLLAVTASDGSGSVPQRGRRAGVSLWIAGLPEACDLNDLAVSFSGVATRGCYLGPIGPGGGCQMNVLLPKGLAPGLARVTLEYRGSLLGEKSIEIAAVPSRDPKVGVVTDGVNLLSRFRIECGTLKAVLEDIENPADVSFSIDGRAATETEFQCVDAFLDHYYYTVHLPRDVPAGKRLMTVRVAGQDLPPVDLEVVSRRS